MSNHAKSLRQTLGLLYLLPTLSLAPTSFAAAPSQHPVFGEGEPAAAGELPAGMLRERLESLPAPAQQRALRWLQSFSFPAADVSALALDEAGGVYYVEPPQTTFDAASDATGPVTADALSTAETFAMHSKPGAANVLYLDFDGHVLENTAWNGGATADTLYARPYDTDGDAASFSAAELAAIHEIWHRVAEDFAPFDVDVTTELPGTFDSRTGRVLITESTDEFNNDMPHPGAGGVAYVGVFGTSYYQNYQPALVYFDNLGSGYPPYVAEAASHEFGHNLNLSHDGTSSVGYFTGLGDPNSFVSWAPIMGVGYYRQVTQWSQGEYPDANNLQDDIAIMLSLLGPRADDHGDDRFSASLLFVDGSGAISHTSPEQDPNNLNPENKGVIESRGDVDTFVMDVGAGSLSLTVTPAWDAFTRSVRRGANLDIRAELMDASGTVIAASDPLSDTEANLQADVEAGHYYLAVTGVGNSAIPYSDYASHGMYFISGQAVSGTPNGAPTAIDDGAATDEDASVGIAVLDNDSDPDGDALSITSASTPASGSVSIAAGTITYTPAADFNGSDSFTYWIGDGRGGSDTATVTITVTPLNDAPQAAPDAASTAFETAANIAVLDNDSDVDGDALSVSAVTPPANGSVSHDGASVTYTPASGFSGTDSFTYTVTDGQASATATVTVSVAAPPPQEPTVPVGFSAVDGTDGTARLTWNDSDHETAYEIERESPHKKRNVWVGTTVVANPAENATAYTDASGSGTFRYRIRAVSATAASAWTAWQEVVVSDTSGGGNDGGGGKGNGGRNKTR